jgi:hypothetical protein
MRVKRYQILFQAEMDVLVYAPEDADPGVVEEIASEIAKNWKGRGWEFPDFEALVSPPSDEELFEEDRKLSEPNQYGFRTVLSGPLAGNDTVVLSDDGDDLVAPEDAGWWKGQEE